MARPERLDGPRLNIGCGHDLRPGWVNIDMHERHHPDLVADALRLAPVADNSAAFALAQDILEHVARDCVPTALRAWNRVLRPGGYLEIRTTDVSRIVALMERPENRNAERHATFLRCLFGTQAYVGDFHLSGFTEVLIRDAFDQAGFEVVQLGWRDEWLLHVFGRKVRHRPPDPLIVTGSDAEFLAAAYRRYLGREPDPQGRDYWLGQLGDRIARETVAAALQAARAVEQPDAQAAAGP